MPMSCLVGYIKNDGCLEMRLSFVVRKYLKNAFLHDLVLVSLEYGAVYMAFLDSDVEEESQSTRMVVRMLRFSRLLKVGRLGRLGRRLLARIKSPVSLALVRAFVRVIGIVVFCHISACLLYLVQNRTSVEHMSE